MTTRGVMLPVAPFRPVAPADLSRLAADDLGVGERAGFGVGLGVEHHLEAETFGIA